MHLTSSVGRRGANDRTDVRRVQRALAELAQLTADDSVDSGPADGVALPGGSTIGAIARFQTVHCHTRRPDGRIDPGGRTLRTLGALLSIYRAAKSGEITFPTDASATSPYHGPGAGMRQFRWRRSRGKRSHAGCDLYHPVGTVVRAVAPGRVVRIAPYYAQTDHIVVEHVLKDGTRFTVVYGETKPGSARVKVGDTVERGEYLAGVGQLILRGKPFKHSMIHFELFTGLRSGRLSRGRLTTARDRLNGSRSFVRRGDLADPTPLLRLAPLP